MKQNNLVIGVGIVVLAGAYYFYNKGHSGSGSGGGASNDRTIVDGEIVNDSNFDKLPAFLEKFNDCLKSDRPDCATFIVSNDGVFKGAEGLAAAIPGARKAMKEVTGVEFLRPTGKILIADTDKHEIPLYTIDGLAKYKNGGTRIHYAVVVQNGEFKVNGYVIDRGPQ